MVGIIEGVEKIFVEWMNVLQAREAFQDSLKLFAECLRGKLDFSSIKAWKYGQLGGFLTVRAQYLEFC